MSKHWMVIGGIRVDVEHTIPDRECLAWVSGKRDISEIRITMADRPDAPGITLREYRGPSARSNSLRELIKLEFKRWLP